MCEVEGVRWRVCEEGVSCEKKIRVCEEGMFMCVCVKLTSETAAVCCQHSVNGVSAT